MPSPFPGMDPYIEGSVWEDFHADFMSALRELLKLEKRGTSSYLDASSWDDPELQRRWARVNRADELERLQSREEKFGITE